MTKRCPKCKDQKDITAFYLYRTSCASTYCKSCENERCRAYAAANKQKLRESRRRYRAEHKRERAAVTARWIAENRAKRDATHQRYLAENKERLVAARAKEVEELSDRYVASGLLRLPPKLAPKALIEAKRQQAKITRYLKNI
jgi:hypothetical protein